MSDRTKELAKKVVEGSMLLSSAIAALSGVPADIAERYIDQGREAVPITHRADIERSKREIERHM